MTRVRACGRAVVRLCMYLVSGCHVCARVGVGLSCVGVSRNTYHRVRPINGNVGGGGGGCGGVVAHVVAAARACVCVRVVLPPPWAEPVRRRAIARRISAIAP